MLKLKLHKASMAIVSDGTVLVNVRTFTTDDSFESAVEAAVQRGGAVFIGVALTSVETRSAIALLDDAVAEIAARVSPGKTSSSPRGS